MYKETKFRLVKNGQRAQGVRSQSTRMDVSKFMHNPLHLSEPGSPGLEDVGRSASQTGQAGLSSAALDIAEAKRKSIAVEGPSAQQKLKYTFRPID